MENPSKNVIDKIKEEHIVPESRLKLSWKSYLFWIIWITMLILGALFFSLITLNFLDVDPRIFHYFGLGRLIFILMRTAPFLWISFSLLALVFGLLAFRKTKRGYRYSLLFATSIGVLIVSILGISFHLAKLNDRISQNISRGLPGQRRLMFPMEERWSEPENKMLGGVVIRTERQNFILVSFGNETWKVFYDPQTEIRVRRNEIIPGMKVGVIGKQIGDSQFEAEFIHDFSGRRFRAETIELHIREKE